MKPPFLPGLRLISTLLALAASLLVSCSTVSPQMKSGLKKVVVINGLSPEVTCYHVGLTVFTNKQAPKISMPELRTKLDVLLATELKTRLPQAQIEFDHKSGLTLVDTKHYKEKNALYARVAQQTGADALVVVNSHQYFPYGIPSSMAAANGLWHSGPVEAGGCAAESFAMLEVLDGKTLKVIGTGWPTAATEAVEVSFPQDGAEFAPQDREKVVGSFMKSITQKVTKTFAQIGL